MLHKHQFTYSSGNSKPSRFQFCPHLPYTYNTSASSQPKYFSYHYSLVQSGTHQTSCLPCGSFLLVVLSFSNESSFLLKICLSHLILLLLTPFHSAGFLKRPLCICIHQFFLLLIDSIFFYTLVFGDFLLKPRLQFSQNNHFKNHRNI